MLDIWLPKRPAEEAMQRSNHWDAKLHPLECKVTPIMVQSYNYQDVIPIFFGFNLASLPTTNAPLPIKSQPSQNCIIIQFECIFMQFWAFLPPPFVKIMPLFLVILAF